MQPPTEIWDANGGTIDPRDVDDHTLLALLHEKVDRFIFPMLSDHETRTRRLEGKVARLLGAIAFAAFLATAAIALLEMHHNNGSSPARKGMGYEVRA